jgi:hypothetical protein
MKVIINTLEYSQKKMYLVFYISEKIEGDDIYASILNNKL